MVNECPISRQNPLKILTEVSKVFVNKYNYIKYDYSLHLILFLSYFNIQLYI